MPGEIFITMAKEGSTISGLMDAFATSISIALQYNVPLEDLCNKFSHMRFEPNGFTNNRQIPIAKSIMDYIFRWLDLKFAKSEEEEADTMASATEPMIQAVNAADQQGDLEKTVFDSQADAPPCHVCGSIMVRSGTCYKCFNCGATSGCS